MTTGEIAVFVDCELVGDAGIEIESAQVLERARGDQIAYWDRRPGQRALPATDAGCVIVDLETRVAGRTLIHSPNPRLTFARVLRALARPEAREPGIHPSASVDSSATLGDEVWVGPLAVIEAGASIGARSRIGPQTYVGSGARLGLECCLHAGARVHGKVILGDRVILHCGAVVGGAGFGLVFEADHYEAFPQVGGVEIGDDVEIGTNSCVDRGALDATRIGSGTKLDNLVHIGHNCQIGRHVVMAAQVGLSGSVTVEDYAVLGGQAGIGDRARIGARARLGGQVGLLPGKELAPGGAYWGTPARPLRQQLVSQANVNRLPRLFEEVRRLRARVEALEGS